MDKNKKQLSLRERWDIDAKVAHKAPWLTGSPQCRLCRNIIKENALSCNVYHKKPREVVFAKKECYRFIPAAPLETNEKEKNSLVIASCFGFCVGDALGVPVEFETREIRNQDPIREMRAYGTYHQYFGTWSDDSSLVFCTMESLIHGYNLNDMCNRFSLFYQEGYWTPFGKVFDIGITTATAMERFQSGIDPIKCGGDQENDNGNGSLMRMLPLVFFLQNKNEKDKLKFISEVSSLTHRHKRSILACLIYIEFMNLLIHKKNKDFAYKDALIWSEKLKNGPFSAERKNFERILSGRLIELDRNQIHSSGYVVDTLEAAIWCFMTSNNFEGTIFNAINLGNDTDTIAAIAGSMAGIYYGFDSIPTRWVETMARKQDIYDLAVSFSQTMGKIKNAKL